MKKIFVFIALLFSLSLFSQEKVSVNVEFDKTIHNFGDVLLSDGPQTCSFKVRNVGKTDVVIYSVVTSCGCTNVTWSKEAINPGKEGTISATYSNDEGPYPFDKTLTAYISDSKKPVILHLRGVCHQKQLPLTELYPIHFGPLGVRSVDVKGSNMEQGHQKSDEIQVANLSKKPVKVEFADVSDHLSVKMSKNPVPAGEVAKIQYTVTADRALWGKNYYYFTPVVDGKKYKAEGTDEFSPGGSGVIGIWTITKEDFSSLTKEEKQKGSRPMFVNNTFTFGKVKPGKQFDATFTFTNEGKSDLMFHKADSDFEGAKLVGSLPTVKPGAKGTTKVHLDTSDMPEGEALVIVQLITNSPTRPLVDLFLTGWITK